MVVFRERTSGHQRPRHLAPGSLRTYPQVHSPPRSRHSPRRPLGALCVRLPLAAAGIGHAGRKLGGRGRTEPGRTPEEKRSPCGCAAPPLVPARLEGARPGCCEGSGRYGAGRPLRPRPLRWRASVSDCLGGKSVAEALWQSLLGVSLSCGPRRRKGLYQDFT